MVAANKSMEVRTGMRTPAPGTGGTLVMRTSMDEYPPEVVTAVRLPWALLPKKERCIRHGLQVAFILDVPDTAADIWISTGPPRRLCNTGAALGTAVNEKGGLGGWEIDGLVLRAASSYGGERELRAARSERA